MASSYVDTENSESSETDSCSDSKVENGDLIHLESQKPGNGNLKDELEEEDEVLVFLNEMEVIQQSNKSLESMLTCLEGVTDAILQPTFQDITNMFSNGAVFFIDGDSLLLNLMGDVNYDTKNGGQLLHLIYLCERHLQLFYRKGGNFEIIFFNIWSQAWSGKHTLLLARSALMSHLRFNMLCKVHEFNSVWDVAFRQILEKRNCAFMLTDFQMLDTYCELFPQEDHMLQELIFHVSICFSLVALYLGLVDMNGVKLTVSTLNAFYCQPGVKLEYVKLKRLLHSVVKTIEDECRLLFISADVEELQLLPMEGETDVRHIVTVSAAARLLRDSNALQPCEYWIRAFLIYSAVLEVLPLSYRGCTAFVVQTPAFTQFVEQLHRHMNCTLQTVLHGGHDLLYNFDTVADLWHGNLFVFVLKYVTGHEICEEILLGEQTLVVYDRLLQEVVRLTGEPLMRLPVTIEGITFSEGAIEAKVNSSTENSAVLLPSLHGLNEQVPTNCLLTSEFCRDVLPRNRHVSDLTGYINRNSKFEEKHHWHSKKPMSDVYDRVRDTIKKPVDKYQLKKHDRIKGKFAHFMSIYGSNIEGRPDSSRSIVCEHGNSSKKKVDKTKKPGKKAQAREENTQRKLRAEQKESDKKLFDVYQGGNSSKKEVYKLIKPGKKTQKLEMNKAEKIRENNRKKLQAELEEKDKNLFDEFKETYKRCKERGSYHAALDEVKLLERKVKTEKVLQSVLLYMVRILWYLWENECKRFPVVLERNLEYVKELFLVIRRVLKDFESSGLGDEDARFLGCCLRKMGLERIAQCWDLPGSSRSTTNQSYCIGMSWIDFQLLHLGPELEREVGSTPDSRVEGFVPDDWQRELFDSVDKHQSLLVVAPTSSGKTYASYYCMERVLRESNDGVVVYVAPTKALVNQVAATIYARFKNKDMPPGKSVYGVFTRDYRTNALNSQILVTVPECLALLLLSPRRRSWVRNLRYVIFDEIHCLAGQLGGFSWECGLLLIRCPFLALSATVEDPQSLHRWLQEMQHFKHEQDIANGCEKPVELYQVNLVVHSDRHADLKKYVFCEDGQFHHIHPYGYLDRTLIGATGYIPQGITLSPGEVHQLYNAMSSACAQDTRLNDLCPEMFFSICTNGFISRKMVRDYEATLKELLQEWAMEDGTTFESVIMALRTVTEPLDKVSEKRFIKENFIPFVQKLKEQNMLPAIVFSYNRSLVHTLFEDATEYYEDIQQNEDSNKKNKSERCKRLEKDGDKDGNPRERKGNNNNLDFRVSRGVPGRNKCEASLNLLHKADTHSGSVRGIGHVDEKVVEFVEHRLMGIGYKQDDLFPRGLSLGIGIHHGGLNSKERSAVEMLFRMKVLNLVFATGTLALGIHMPCKTVVVISDSTFLNPLEFQQMSGRAGRRGFDTEGNVVFMGLNERKMRSLLTGKLPRMVGNFPLNVTMVLRLLLMVSDSSCNGARSEEATRDALSRALTLLNYCLVYQTVPELKIQMKHFFALSTQLLMLQGLLDDEGNPQYLTGIVTHLHYHEPGNLAFVYLLRSGALRMLCQPEKDGTISKKTQLNVVLVLSYLFAPLILHKRAQTVKYSNSKVVLPPLPPKIKTVLEMYNAEVMCIYDNYFRCVASDCADRLEGDETLPMSRVRIMTEGNFRTNAEGPMTLQRYIVESCEPRAICSLFAALSGHTDRGLYSHHNMVSNIRHQVFTDIKVAPIVELDETYNGYAWDFYNHGIAAAIKKDNRLKQGDDFALLNDFLLMLKVITVSLSELEPVDKNDPVLKTFTIIEEKFATSFNKAYGIITRY